MAKICYTKDGNKKSLLSLTEKITTPSIKIVGPDGTFYTPLFNSTAATVDKDRYRYTLTNFKVGNYRAAESRAWIKSKPVVSEYYYAYNLRWIAPGITFFLGIGATDPDGDQLTWTWTSSDEKPASAYHHDWELEYSVYNEPHVIQVKGNKNIGYVTFYANISDGYESINSSISVNITSLCYLNMIDHMTRYTGSINGFSTGLYTSEYWNRITGFEDHDGTPFLQFIGFPDDYVGHQVGFVFVKDHVHNHITEKFPDLYPDNGWDGAATITLDIWNDTRNVMLNGSRNESDIPGGGHGAIRVGSGYLPYGKYTFCAFLESRTDPGKYYVYCCHIDNELTGHGSVD